MGTTDDSSGRVMVPLSIIMLLHTNDTAYELATDALAHNGGLWSELRLCCIENGVSSDDWALPWVDKDLAVVLRQVKKAREAQK